MSLKALNFVSVKQTQHGEGVLVWDALLQQDLVQHQRITTNPRVEEKLLEEDAKASVKQFKRR